MIDDLQEAFREMLTTNDWMDKQTKATALDKAKQMLRQIAYPDFILDDAKLDDYYGGVKFPAAILQAPFFHHTFPRALNYGGIGAVIGHEITHGFDDEGRQFDSVGNLREWWDPEVKKKFQERAQCIINQYGKIEVPGTGFKISGKLTQGENIADNGGVKQAFRAYKNYLRKRGEERRVKGLEQYNNDQMFFLGYAMVECGHMTKEAMINQLITNPHSPHRNRVNQVLANQPEFATAFQCDLGTPMNPIERCAVW
ncbi:peptidase family M13 [Necator americanus]|uniref:Peptidase family M13 n=1 Tax=Necator americanus TaxID=51031 RepID=W2TAS9_NECAM|nr:peptidase family M13 [Necator americanus]ETN79145.1 peptidase family M13 [Necator americanus]